MSTAVASSRNRWIAVALCFIVGPLGAHRFYLGYTMQGVIQLLTFGGLGLWVLFDLVMLLMNKLPDADGNALA